MKVGTIIETVYQRVAGMKPNAESLVKRIDIRAYLPAAINYAVMQQYYINIQNSLDLNELPRQFVATFEDVKVEYSEPRDLRYISLPADAVPLPNDGGIDTVSAMQGNVSFSPIRDQFELSGYEAYTGGNTKFWIEGKRIYFKNLSPYVKTVLLRMMASVDDLDDDDNAPIPSGLESEVIDMCVQYFVNGRALPHDDIVDSTERLNMSEQ